MKIKRNYLYAGIILVVIVLTVVIFYLLPIAKQPQETKEKASWSVDKNGYLSYPLEREPVNFNRQDYAQTENLTIHKVVYRSRNDNIYGLLVLPSTATDLLPGIVLLPGAGVSKESELELAKKISQLNAAVLVIDQRGIGETDGKFPTLDEDFNDFIAGKEPVQHLMVYDALRAYDLLKSAQFIDTEKIIIVGESLGGRIAVIATAIDSNIAGTLVISSSGFDFKDKGDKSKDTFLKSIDADHYVDLIAPRKIVFIHNANDKIIPVSSAINSYSKAQSPKQLVLINDTSCNHGYCDSMYEGLADSLDYLVDIRSRTLISVPDVQ